MKKILSIVLLLSMLLCTFCACGDKDKEEGVKALSGEVGEDLLHGFVVSTWNENAAAALENGRAGNKSVSDLSFDKFETLVKEKNKIKQILFYLQNHEEIKGKKIKKVSFEIEASEETSVYFYLFHTKADYNDGSGKLVNLKADEPLKVELNMVSDYEIKEEVLLSIELYPDENKSYLEKAQEKESTDWEDLLKPSATPKVIDGFEEWSKVEYKITNFNVYVD